MNNEKNVTSSKKPKVAIIHFSGPPHVDGVDIIIRDQARLFRQHNYKVEIIAGTAKRFRKDIPVHVYKLIRPKHPKVYQVRLELEKGIVSPLFSEIEKKLYHNLKQYFIKNNIGVCIIHNVFTRHYNLALTSVLTTLSKEMTGIKFIVWIHDITFYNQPDFHLDKKLAQKFPWDLLVTPHKDITYVCVSDFLKNDILSTFTTPIDPSKIITIPNTHDIQKFLGLSPNMRKLYDHIQAEESDLIASIPVRAVPRKRLDFAIDVAKEIVDRGVKFKLLLTANIDTKRVENINYHTSLKKKITDLHLENNVFLLEEFFQQFSQLKKPPALIPIHELFLMSDLLLMTSSLEGFGMPLIEAGLMRCPIFSTDIPPFREIGTTSIHYFKLTDSPAKVADLILNNLKTMPQSYFYRKVITQYSLKKMFKEKVVPLLAK